MQTVRPVFPRQAYEFYPELRLALRHTPFATRPSMSDTHNCLQSSGDMNILGAVAGRCNYLLKQFARLF